MKKKRDYYRIIEVYLVDCFYTTLYVRRVKVRLLDCETAAAHLGKVFVNHCSFNL